MKHVEKKAKVKEYFRATEVGMMIEVFQDDLKMVAEDLAGFRENVEMRLEKIEKNQEVTLEYLFAVGDRLDVIEKDLKEIKAELKNINENKIDKNELETLKAKVQKLETELKKAVEWQKNQQKLAGA